MLATQHTAPPPRRSSPIRIHDPKGPDRLHESGAIIGAIDTSTDFGVDAIFILYDADEKMIASARSAAALSKFAFDRGAVTVKHDYDLKLEEE